MDEIEVFGREYVGVKLGIEDSTLRQNIFLLQKVKEVCKLDDLRKFKRADYITLNNHMSQKGYRKNYMASIISALRTFFNIMGLKTFMELDEWKPKAVGKVELEKAEHDKLKGELVDLVLVNFDKIFNVDLTRYNKNFFICERDRFMVIHSFYCGLRRSEVCSSLVEDAKEIVNPKTKYKHKVVVVRVKKTKQLSNKVIDDIRYWNSRNKYLELHTKEYPDSPFLFPNTFGGGRLSETRINQIMTGYFGKETKKYPDGWREGICGLVWGGKIWPHVFRHSRTTDLSSFLSLEELQKWRGDKSVLTTRRYIDDQAVDQRVMDKFEKINKEVKNG